LIGSVVRALPLRFYSTIDGSIEKSTKEHPEIIAALRERDSDHVRSLMAEHIAHGADRLIASLEGRGLWSEETEASD
jgi:DNA-binding GntR family transcriptional regulator